jgi:hypothetical protein
MEGAGVCPTVVGIPRMTAERLRAMERGVITGGLRPVLQTFDSISMRINSSSCGIRAINRKVSTFLYRSKL